LIFRVFFESVKVELSTSEKLFSIIGIGF